MRVDRPELQKLVVAGCWALAAAHVAWLQPWTVDDAFIVFRYAENWVAGHGPVFNPGEWVEGYSSPAWLALIAAAHALGVPTVLASKLFGVAAVLTVPAVLAHAHHVVPLSARGALIAAVIAATSGPMLVWAGGGLEATLAALVALGAWLGHVGGRRWAVPLCAVAPLVRPELALIPLVAGLDHALARRWTHLLRLGAATVALVGAHEMVRLWAYGWPLPNPFYAKVGATSHQLLRGLRYLGAYSGAHGHLLVLVGVAAWLGRTSYAPVACWVALHTAALVAVGGDVLPAWRLMVPVIPAAAWGAAVVLERGSLAGLGVVAAWQLWIAAADPRESPQQTDVVWVRGREAGLWLREHLPPHTTIAVNTAGSVPYYSGLETIDMLGLCDETTAHTPVRSMGRGTAGHEKGNGAHVLSRSPDLVMFGAAPGRRTPAYRADRQLYASPAFQERYVFETHPLPSGRALKVWRRRDGPKVGVEATPPGDDRLAQELAAVVREEELLSAVLVLAGPDGPQVVRTHGADASEPVPIGSARKLFTAAVVLTLVDEGRLSLDAPVGDWLPGWEHDGITLRRLLSHTSGLPPRPTGRRCADAADLAACVDALAEEPLRDPPGERFHYSSAGFMVAARVAEVAGGRPFPELLRDRVLTPIGARDTTLRSGGPSGLEGTVWSTPTDFVAFLRMLLRGGELDGVPILSEAAVAELERGQTGGVRKRGVLPRRAFPEGHDAYGLGWWRNHQDEHGRLLVASTYGKPGFLAWIDRSAGVVGVLSVRKPTRDGERVTYDDLVTRFTRVFSEPEDP